MRDNVAAMSLLPLSVFVAGLDLVTPGHPCYTFITTFLRQNGF
jgi:hypothetical protein